MKNCVKILCIFLIFLGVNYADTTDFECNDLYGNCNIPVIEPKGDSKKDSIKSIESSGVNSGDSIDIAPISPVSPANQSTKIPKNPQNIYENSQEISSPNVKKENAAAQNAFLPSGNFSRKKGSFLYSVVLLTALFDNGVQKQGYGILIKDGYTIAAADLMNEEGAYLRSVTAKMQDDTSNSLMCFAMLRLRATDSKLSLLRAENYTDIYCNTRPESFYHQRINLHYFTPIRLGTLKHTILGRNDNVLFPFVTENNTLAYRSSSIANIQKHSAIYGMPLFNSSGGFVGFLYTDESSGSSGSGAAKKRKNVVISSDEVRNFICNVARNNLLPTSDLTRSCR